MVCSAAGQRGANCYIDIRVWVMRARRPLLFRCVVAVIAWFYVAPAYPQCGLVWEQLDYQTPTPRWAHSVAFDSDRGVLVLFGGYTSDTDTWEFHSLTN